jgi:hypothetical protein
VRLIDEHQPGIDQRVPDRAERADLVALVPHLETALAPATKADIRRMIAKLAMGFPNAHRSPADETEARLELYAMALADIPADILGGACMEALRTHTFLPTPAEIRRLCRDPHRRAFRLSRAKYLIALHDQRNPTPVDDTPLTDAEREELDAILRRLDAAA